ncbi:MAG: cardiolipin synthase [Verrucomicrobiota bacterium]
MTATLISSHFALPSWAWGGTVALTVLQWALVPHLLSQRNKSPNAMLAWLWAILLFPGLGALFYLLMGSERLHRRRLRLVHDLERQRGDLRRRAACPVMERMPEMALINGFEPACGNHADLLRDGESFFAAMLEMIAGARRHLHVEFYIWHRDQAGRKIRDALAEAAERGVEVRVLLDEMGSVTMTRRFFRRIRAAGGRFSWFHTFAPLKGRIHLNLRNHRKLVIADGVEALTGGINVGNEYWTGEGKGKPPYRDLGLRMRGPVVEQLSEVFAEDWYFATGEALLSNELYYPENPPAGEMEIQVVPGGPDNDLNEIQLTVLAILQRAQHSVRLITPYFVPEDAILSALQLAAMRGVTIELMVPAKGDHSYLTHVTRSFYEDLLPYGIRVYEYLPGMLHAKLGIFDGTSSMCGSANLDVRSLRINFELNVAVISQPLAGEFNTLFEESLRDCREVSWEEHQRRGFKAKFMEALCRPLASLL